MPGSSVEAEPVVVRREGLGLFSLAHFEGDAPHVLEERDVYLPQAVGVLRPPPFWNDQPSKRCIVLHVAKGEVPAWHAIEQARSRRGTVASMAYAGAPGTPGPDASHSCSLRMGASPRSSSPNTVGFFSMSSARGRFVGPSLKFGGKRQEAICAVARKARQRMRRRSATHSVRALS